MKSHSQSEYRSQTPNTRCDVKLHKKKWGIISYIWCAETRYSFSLEFESIWELDNNMGLRTHCFKGDGEW